MSGVLARLNLRPQEQRLVVVIGLVLFVVLNLWFVWPHFNDWSRVQLQLAKARATLADYQKEVAQAPQARARLAALEKQGSAVLPADQARHLESTIRNEATRSGVVIAQETPVPTPRTSAAATNQFFEEQTERISVSTGEKELVNFLYALGSGNSMIRVRDMDLRPDPGSGRTRLLGNLTLVASYQKKVETNVQPKPATPARRPAPKAAPRRGRTTMTPAHPPPARTNRHGAWPARNYLPGRTAPDQPLPRPTPRPPPGRRSPSSS